MSTREQPHVDDGALLALLDGELTTAERRSVEERVAACPDCAARLDEMRFAMRRATAALDLLSAPEARREMPAALREAARRAPASLQSARARRWARLSRRSVAVAAGITLLVAAGAYAVPGSPVKGWVDGGIDAVAVWIAGEPRVAGDAGPSRVSVDPRDGAVRIMVVGGHEGARLTVELSDEETATVAARDASFHVEPGVIEVAGAADEIRVTLPRNAAIGSVVIDETEVVRLEGGELRRTDSAAASRVEIFLDTDG
ncbi:anti-sigma factor family protein [Candidatus Palauibacter irciniicola]|uniref:anti-sigma factor family protein n=1 Tax=Candidatus Palauibacter irciniicola TaxID=3056733 RepID=UPI003B022881